MSDWILPLGIIIAILFLIEVNRKPPLQDKIGNIDNSLEYAIIKQANPHTVALYVISKSFLGTSINKNAVVNYLDSQQQADGSWIGGWTPMFTSHRVLMTYYLLNAKPLHSMDFFFQKYNTWEKAKNYILYETKSDLRDIYHIVFGWVLYYWQYPPWINEFFTVAESNLEWTISSDFHKRTHILYSYVIARRQFPNLNEIISTTLNEQLPDGHWDVSSSSRPVYYTSIQLSLLNQILQLYLHYRATEIYNAIIKSRQWVYDAYHEQVLDSKICGYFGDIQIIEDALLCGILSAGQNQLMSVNIDMTFQDIVNRII